MSQSVSEQFSPAKRQLLERYLQGNPRPQCGSTTKADTSTLPSLAGAEHQAPLRRTQGDVDSAPLSAGQRLIWLHSSLASGTPLYNEPWTIHFSGELDVPSFQRAVNEFVRRHEAWRTVFPIRNGQPVQEIRPPFEINLQLTDLRHLPPADREREATFLAEQDARLPFDLALGPLLRLRLVQFDDRSFRLYLTLHHIIFDGFSIYRIFLQEVAEMYQAFHHGMPSPLPEPTIQVKECALRRLHCPEKEAEELAFWSARLSDNSTLDLPTTSSRPEFESFSGSMCRVFIPGDLRDELRRLGAHQRASLFMVLLAAFYLELHLYSHQEVFAVGSVTAGRNHSGFEKVVGYCLNTIVLRADLRGRPTFLEILRRAREDTLTAMAHDEVPLDTLVRELNWQRHPSRNPLYDVMFSLEPSLAAVDGKWNLTQVEVETGAAKLDLYFELDERCEGITGKLMYKTSLFSPEDARATVDNYIHVLRTVARNPAIQPTEIVLPAGLPGQQPHLRETSTKHPELDDYYGADQQIEAVLLTLWEQLLHKTAVNPLDNFFYCGGHSLTAVQLLASIEKHFGVPLQFAELVQAPTPRQFARTLSRRLRVAGTPAEASR